MYLLFSCIILFLGVPSVGSQNTGSFWHVTDFHFDPSYTSSRNSCHTEAKQRPLGQYGDYLCDSPYALINSSMYAMRDIEDNPDFIIWTGDDTPHTSNDNLDESKVLSMILNLTHLLMEVFPNTPVYAALGNHDYHPKHLMPPHSNPIYNAVADSWKAWFRNDVAEQTFRNGGFYTLPMARNGSRVVVLNTVYYYTNDKLTANDSDPAGQLAWLDEVLTNATLAKEKVHIVAHVPPGHFERHRTKYWFYPQFNKKFQDLIVKFSSVIAGMYFAHEHTDNFRLFYNQQDYPVAAMFIAPAVTPWQTTLPNMIGSAANNPGIRLFKYNRDTSLPTDIWQHYLNLTQTNMTNTANWQLEYKASEMYGIRDLSPQSLNQLVLKFKRQNSEEFRKYYQYNTASIQPGETCGELCKKVHICSITNIDYDDFEKCVIGAVSAASTVCDWMPTFVLLSINAVIASIAAN
ncbi:acid sphingomyelinase-like phosphodiesterase 3b isoform X2 [Lingula anatina]|uniref:Sphingomyelinase phosphodiesterase n=1 Tax=Lingula anatina TaxID=7574 RepID=A0A1S3K3C4_LINAN|nr:acid sphingomyelinase-like phosphodiesterase 3b isoform X2 [Lingula anatina]|eukprot:XP_013417120.1 acid sphingomyelinase-like phosphodiesterase 3b isoform X2 [Lingula anatina]